MALLAHPPPSYFQLKSFSSQQTPLRMNVANNDCEVNDYHHQTIIWSLILVVWFILMYYKVGFQNITRTRKTFTSLVEPPLDLHSGFCDSFHYLRTLFSASGMDVVLFLSISVPVSHIRSQGLVFIGLFSPKSSWKSEQLINIGSTWRQNLVIPVLKSQNILFRQVSVTNTKLLLVHCKFKACPESNLNTISLTFLFLRKSLSFSKGRK